MHKFPQTNRNLLIALCVQQQSEAQQRRTDRFLCPGGVSEEGGEEGGRVCVCFFFLQHLSYQKSHRPSVRCRSRCHGNWRGEERRGERASLKATQSTGGKLHIVFAHKNTAMRNV